MAGTYELHLTNDFGVRLGEGALDDILWFSATRSDHAIGSFSAALPTTFDISLLKPDHMIQVWRAPRGGRLALWRPFFIRKWRLETRGARDSILVFGRGPKDLLRRRIVAAYSGVAQSAKIDFADDMMKEIMTEAVADGVAPVPAAGTRVWNNFSIAANTGSGPTLTKAFAWQRLHRLMPEIQRAAREAGVEVFFDIVPDVITTNSISFQFRTSISQPPGGSVRNTVFAQESGNMTNPFLEFDYTEEENYIYAGGQGQGALRNIQQVSDIVRFNASQWNRNEAFAVAMQQTVNNGVRETGRARLESGRPRRRFGATPIDTAGTRFGRDWDYGDVVTARYRGSEFQTVIRAVTLSVENEKETISARLEFED